jgi:2-oxoisovalerate dehydrogenase E1 component
MHLFDAATNFYGGNAIVGGGLPLAGGLALADRMRGEARHGLLLRRGRGGRRRVPRDDEPCRALGPARAVHLRKQRLRHGHGLGALTAETDIREKAAAYNIEAEAVDGMDVVAVEAAARRALAASARPGGRSSWNATPTGSGPIPCSTPSSTATRTRSRVARSGAHRALPGLASGKRSDPRSDVAEIEARVDAEIAEAVAFAEAGTWEPWKDLTKHVLGPQPDRRCTRRAHRVRRSR